MPTRYRMGDVVLSLMSTITQFGNAEVIAPGDLGIEMMVPANAAIRQALTAITGH